MDAVPRSAAAAANESMDAGGRVGVVGTSAKRARQRRHGRGSRLGALRRHGGSCAWWRAAAVTAAVTAAVAAAVTGVRGGRCLRRRRLDGAGRTMKSN